jgi:hypothetical protein
VTTLMWEARPAAGRLDALLAQVLAHADAAAQVYRSGGTQPRVVVIDPTGRGLPDLDTTLFAGPPHAWSFEPVER